MIPEVHIKIWKAERQKVESRMQKDKKEHWEKLRVLPAAATLRKSKGGNVEFSAEMTFLITELICELQSEYYSGVYA